MIFIDTETTGLLVPSANELSFQPYITEVYAVKMDDDYKFIADVDTLVKPPVPITEEITRITGIDNKTVAKAPSFVSIYDSLVDLFLGERYVVGHNISFDMGVLWSELARAGLELNFPWPPVWICTIEKSRYIEGRRLKLKDLHERATGMPHAGAHRAKGDVMALIRCHMWLKKEGAL